MLKEISHDVELLNLKENSPCNYMKSRIIKKKREKSIEVSRLPQEEDFTIDKNYLQTMGNTPNLNNTTSKNVKNFIFKKPNISFNDQKTLTSCSNPILE